MESAYRPTAMPMLARASTRAPAFSVPPGLPASRSSKVRSSPEIPTGVPSGTRTTPLRPAALHLRGDFTARQGRWQPQLWVLADSAYRR